MLRAYELTGGVSACQFSSAQLAAALKGVDTYDAQYFQDFTNAINSALGVRAAGGCQKTHARAQPASARATTALAPPGSVTAATDAGVPAPIVLMAVIGGLIALAAAIGSLVRLGERRRTR